MPIITWPGTSGAWEWRVDGMLVANDTLERYLRDVVGEMGAAQAVTCAPKHVRIALGERIECALANGGKAFVTVREDGSTSVEVELDRHAAAARSESARDEDLTKTSRALERAEQDDDDGDEPVTDAGLAVESAP